MKLVSMRVAMLTALIAITGGFVNSYAQTPGPCSWEGSAASVFKATLWRDPTQIEKSFWAEKAMAAGYKRIGKTCGFFPHDKILLVNSIMDWAIADRSRTTEISQMVDRVFQRATGAVASKQDHSTLDDVVRTQRMTAPQMFAQITPDLAIKDVVDVPNDPKAVNVHIINKGEFSTRLVSVLRLEINNGPGCTGKIAGIAEFNTPVLNARQDAWVKVSSTERLKLSGLQRPAYKLTADAKTALAESDETNNETCVPAYIIK